MNNAESIEIRTNVVFSPQQVREARALAVQTKRSVAEVLEEQTGLDAESFVKALGELLHYPVFLMEGLKKLIPAFDILPFAEVLERECLVLRTKTNG